MNEKFLSLDFNRTRQVRIRIDSSNNTEDIRLMANGIEYTHNCELGDYAGCGVDAAQSFMGWFNDDIPRSVIKNKIEVTKWPSDMKNFIILNISVRTGRDIKTKNDYYTTPAEMSVGLEKLIKKTVRNRKNLENNIIRHTKGTDASVIAKIRHHLRRGMPVVALIDEGTHWVTLVGIKCKYKSNNEIDVNNTEVTYIDLTKKHTYPLEGYPPIMYTDLNILDWSSGAERLASSYKSGTVISLKSDSILYENSWTGGWRNGWNSDIYNINGMSYLFLLKESTGLVHIHKIKKDGSIGSRLFKYNWSKGWSNINFYTINNQTYLFLMKAGSEKGYTSGLVHINKMNSDGSVGKMIKEYDWRAGWRNIEFFSLKNKTYLLLNKRDGQTHIHEMKSNGTVKSPAVLITRSFIKESGNVQSVEAKNEVYFYGVEGDFSRKSKKGLYSQYKFYNKKGKFKLELVETRKWSKYWTDINIFKSSAKKSFFIIYKGALDDKASLNGRNGIMHIHEIKDFKNGSFKGNLGKLIDDNYYRNRKMMLHPTEMWSTIKYFRATNGKLKLFLLDKFSGRVRVMNMQKDGGFEKQLTVSKPVKSYRFDIRTSAIKKAGTDAKVFITLKGKNWTSPEYQIDTICNDFEKGTTVRHAVPVNKYFGDITQIVVRHDNSGQKAGWHLKDIKIFESTTTKGWKFVSNQWFATTVGDGKIKRILSVS